MTRDELIDALTAFDAHELLARRTMLSAMSETELKREYVIQFESRDSVFRLLQTDQVDDAFARTRAWQEKQDDDAVLPG